MPRPPNILWIVTTQWRAQACGYAGDPNARTPQLDRLAAEGLNFAQAVTPHPFGPFARAALLTGVPSPRNGVRDYFDPLPADARTVAHRLAAAGYATAFFGKWHLAERARDVPLVGEAHARQIVPAGRRGGFAFWEGFEGGFLLNDPWLHGTRLPEPVQFPGYQSDVVCARAWEWLARAAPPWFAVVSLEAPHPPYGAPSGDVKPRAAADLELGATVPRGGETEARARRELAGYHAHITATDTAIGRLAAGTAAEDTVVAVTSVHGDQHGAHGLFRKGWPHEESVRVPLVVRVPERIRPEWAGAAGTMPATLLDLPGWAETWARGERWAPVDAARGQGISMPSVVALPDQCDRIWRGVRTPRRKLVLNADGTPWLFFDLERDPGETRNLADDPAWAEEIGKMAAGVGE